MKNKQKSIKNKLINLISLSLAVILSICFLIIDQSLDGWADKQFANEMSSQAFIFKSVVMMNASELNVLRDNELLPTASTQTTYYQIWKNNTLVKKSHNLLETGTPDLIKYDIPKDSTRIIPVTLPNGDAGIATLTEFTHPAVNDAAQEDTFYVTIYNSTKKLDNVLYVIDTLLIMSFIISILLTRLLARKIVSMSLKPLFDLNNEIISLSKMPQKQQHLSDDSLYYQEIAPIHQSINHFIDSNQALIKNEKRITGDIAHELKTPIAELISLTEVYEKFPDDPRIATSYTQDILAIANEMKRLITGLLYLQESQHDKLTQTQPCQINQFIEETLRSLNIHTSDCIIKIDPTLTTLSANPLSLSIILRNLIDNANFYKPLNSKIQIVFRQTAGKNVLIIENSIREKLSADSMRHLTKPLFKVDKSRKNNQHYGLGLTIVTNLCAINGNTLTLAQRDDLTFYAILCLNPHQRKSQVN